MERMRKEPGRRRRVMITLALLAVVAVGLYGVTLLRFGAMMAGGR